MYIFRVNIGAHTYMHTHKDDVCRTESCVMIFVVYAVCACVSLCTCLLLPSTGLLHTITAIKSYIYIDDYRVA